jgi:hypothetical protein
MYIQELQNVAGGVFMNLRAAQKELRSRSPQVEVSMLALEAAALVSFSMLLVALFT